MRHERTMRIESPSSMDASPKGASDVPPTTDRGARPSRRRETDMSRPSTGFGHYLRDMVYGALDGVITTMAILAGSQGASLSARIGLILGLADLIGDGISMGASNYLGLRSEIEQAGGSLAAEAPWRHGLATVAAFVVVGSAPLAAYAAAPLGGGAFFPAAAGFS